MEYAIIETAGRQYRIEKDKVIEVENSSGSNVGPLLFDKVLLYVNDSDVKIGKPYIENLKVKANILEELKGKKVRVARFAAKVRHRRRVGFRSSILRIKIEDIVTAK